MVPSQDQSRLQVRLTTTIGSNLGETDRRVQKAEAILEKHPELIRVQSTVSIGSASLSLTLGEPKERTMTQAESSNTIRRELQQVPGLRASVQDLSQQGFAGGRGKPVEISVRGTGWNAQLALAQKSQKELQASGLA